MHLLGHEGPNSLLAFLIDKGLATEITSFTDHYMNSFSMLGIDITLTHEGFENYEKVVVMVFNFIKMLKESEIHRWIWEEI